MIKKYRDGFTLVEIIVAVGVFGILVLAGTDFVIQMIRANNQTVIQNEVRQNASRVMQQLTDSVRNAGCVSWTGTANTNKILTIYSDKDCLTAVDKYDFKITGGETGSVWKGLSTSVKIISGSVAACADTGCGSECLINGLTSPEGTSNSKTGGTVTLSLTLQQMPRAGLRSDFCGRVTLTETVTPRQY